MEPVPACMFRSLGARAVLVASALLAVSAILPLATADHAYSHRYIIFGRVLDANGDPVEGVTVNFGYTDFTPEGACANQPDTDTEAHGRTQTIPKTNAFGEFIFCAHVHSLSRAVPGTAILKIPEEDNFTTSFEMDPYFRTDYKVLQLPHVSAHANKTSLDEGFLLQGRLWVPHTGTISVEQIGVFGTTVNNVPVNLTFTHDGKTESFQTSTNNYGDWAFRVNTTSRVKSGSLTVDANGENRTFAIDEQTAKTGVFTVKIREEGPPSQVLRGLLIGLGIVVGLGVVGGAGWYGYRRASARREEANIRAASSRKRANK